MDRKARYRCRTCGTARIHHLSPGTPATEQREAPCTFCRKWSVHTRDDTWREEQSPRDQCLECLASQVRALNAGAGD